MMMMSMKIESLRFLVESSRCKITSRCEVVRLHHQDVKFNHQDARLHYRDVDCIIEM